ncbi:MAG TPA: DinB family protein [Vicinamibacterales bacterium]|nr:DinB family protein [Vicinamibacterales bacterium]
MEALLDSWDRNNTITTNLLRAVPDDALGVRVMATSPTVAQTFAHLIYIRLVHVLEDAPEFASGVPAVEWANDVDRDHLVRQLTDSAAVVRAAVRARLEHNQPMDLHYDHPLLMIQHLLWHEAYHHGQIKLACKIAGRPITDDRIGTQSWGIWMDKTAGTPQK